MLREARSPDGKGGKLEAWKGDPDGSNWKDYKTAYHMGSKVPQSLLKRVTGKGQKKKKITGDFWCCSEGGRISTTQLPL